MGKTSVKTPLTIAPPKPADIAYLKLWEKFPELKGRKLTNDPKDGKYKKEWAVFFREARSQQIADTSKATSNLNNLGVLTCATSDEKGAIAIPNLPTKSKKEQEKCRFNSLKVDKADRKYTLNITPGQDKSLPLILEVVGGEEFTPALISAKLIGLVQAGATCNHLKSTFNYFLADDELIGKPTLTDLKFKAYGPSFSSYKIWNAKPFLYSFNISTCGAQTSCTVAVFPDTTYDITLEFPAPEKKNENTLTPKDNFNNIEIENKKSFSWGVKVSGSVKKDGISKVVEYEFQNEINKIKKISTISKGLQEHLSILNNGGRTEPVSFTIQYPNLKFHYKGNWAELEGNPLCDFQNELSILFDPLIGVEVTVDIIAAAAIAIGGPIGKVVLRIRELAEKNIDISFTFSLSGNAGGGWTGQYLRNAKQWKSSNKDITVTISAVLEAKAEATLDLYIAYIGGGAKGTAKGSIEFKAIMDNEANLKVTAQHNGLKLTGCMYAKGGWKSIFADDDEDDDEADSEKNDFKGKLQGEIDIIPCQEFPLVIYE